MKKIFIGIMYTLAFTALWVSPVHADEIAAGPLEISYPGNGPIFSEINIAPGDEYSKELSVTNNGDVSHSFAMATKNVEGELAKKVMISPIVAGKPVWELSVFELSELSQESQTIIDTLSPGQSETVELTAYLLEDAGSDYENMNLSFDIVFGAEEPEPGAAVSGGDITVTSSGLLTDVPVALAGQVSPTVAPTDSPVDEASQGQVLGAEDEGQQEDGLNPLLLLIPPAALVLSIPFASPGARNAVVPTVGAGATAVLGYYSKGDLSPNIFWIILALELVIILILDYLIAEKVISEVVHEEEVLEKKEERAHRQHK